MPRRRSRRRPSFAALPVALVLTLGRRTLAGLRDLTLALALVSAVSSLPSSLTEHWSPHAQHALAIGRDIRGLVHEVLRELADGLADTLERRTGVPADRGPTPPSSVEPATQGPPRVPASYAAAKKLLYERVYADRRRTFYCGCAYDLQGRPALDGCGLANLADESRARRVEAEHVFPAAQFGRSRRCWRDPAAFAECVGRDGAPLSGRDCCERVDPTFAAAHNDLQNLVPAVGALNGKRSDYTWGMVGAGGERVGECALRIDSGIGRVEPPAGVRGDIARTMLYMRDTYGFRLSRQDERLFAAWSNADLPDAWEIERNRRIAKIQGRGNRYVEDDRRP